MLMFKFLHIEEKTLKITRVSALKSLFTNFLFSFVFSVDRVLLANFLSTWLPLFIFGKMEEENLSTLCLAIYIVKRDQE